MHRKLVRIHQQEEYWTSTLNENDPFKRIFTFRQQQKAELQRKIDQILSNNVGVCVDDAKIVAKTNAT